MILQQIARIITWPVKAFFKIFRRGAKSSAAQTTVRTGGSVAAKAAPDSVQDTDLLDEEYREDPPSGLEAAMFKQLPRPRLTEKSASELTIEQARNYANQARRFYNFDFPLFARGDFFYEEIEEQFLNSALGHDDDESIDQRYIDVTTLFRRTLNANTRRLILYWTPLLGAAAFAAAAALAPGAGLIKAAGVESPWVEAGLLYGGAALLAAFLAFVVYSWPYKVVQQRNLMNLDNYVTSKFARINNNFQVAKRRALNIEREKRMTERDALKDEAGAWTLSYHWFATRLFLCETMLRNKFYQVRRNTTLYWVAGLALTAVLLTSAGAGLALSGSAAPALAAFAAASLGYMVLAGAITGRATEMMFRVLESNEWSRFHLIDLNTTIRDHVGEDKLQIITFRDRNRFE